jgi:nucleotide-binding universal stress UspA family protein
MYKLINNILVPVNVQLQPSGDIGSAIGIARQFNCDVHLLHVNRRPFWSVAGKRSSQAAARKLQLNALRDQYTGFLSQGCMIHTEVREGNPENIIAEYAAIHNVDLILAQRLKSIVPGLGFGLDINTLAAKTSCPVLSLLPGPGFTDIKNIVLPVSGSLPLRRVKLATYLAKHFDSSIHLLSLGGNAAQESRNEIFLRKTFRLLKENTNLEVSCKTVVGENIADTTLEYAKNIQADLILVNPGPESLLSGPVNRLFAKFLCNQSSIPVITVA